MSEYTEAVASGLEGLRFVSVGSCPGCQGCMDDQGYDSAGEHEEAWGRGDICEEPSFSWRSCGICGSSFGGDRGSWHWVSDDNAVQHESDACVDCIMYLANGDEPESWQQHPS